MEFLSLVCVASATVHFHGLTLRTASSLCPKLIPIDSADIQHCEHTKKRSQKGCTDGYRSCNFPSPPPEGELTAESYWFFSQQVMEWVEGFLASMDGKDGVLT